MRPYKIVIITLGAMIAAMIVVLMFNGAITFGNRLKHYQSDRNPNGAIIWNNEELWPSSAYMHYVYTLEWKSPSGDIRVIAVFLSQDIAQSMALASHARIYNQMGPDIIHWKDSELNVSDVSMAGLLTTWDGWVDGKIVWRITKSNLDGNDFLEGLNPDLLK